MKPAIKYREYYDLKLTYKIEKVKNFMNCSNTEVKLMWCVLHMKLPFVVTCGRLGSILCSYS